MAKQETNGVYTWVPTPHRIGKKVVFAAYELDRFAGYRCRLTNAEVRKRQSEPGMSLVGIPRYYKVETWQFENRRK